MKFNIMYRNVERHSTITVSISKNAENIILTNITITTNIKLKHWQDTNFNPAGDIGQEMKSFRNICIYMSSFDGYCNAIAQFTYIYS
jgi:hypothetical protein